MSLSLENNREREATSDWNSNLFVQKQSPKSETVECGEAAHICTIDCATPRIDIVDKNADVTLIVGRACQHMDPDVSDAIAFGIQSRTIVSEEITSKKFRDAMVSASRIGDDGIWLIRLPEDRAEPMETLLRCMHSQFRQKDLDCSSIQRIHRVVALAEKYELTHLLFSVARDWLNGFKNPEASLTLAEECRCLSMAWALGDKTLMKTLIGSIARRCTVRLNVDKTADNRYQLGFPTYNVPGVYSVIGELRLKSLRLLLDPLRGSVSDLITGEEGADGSVKCLDEEHDPDAFCNLMLLSSLQRSLSDLNLWPIPDPEKYQGSFSAIFEKIKELQVQCDSKHGRRGCNKIIKNGMPRWIPELPKAELSEVQVKHLRERAKKIGYSDV